MTPKMFCVCHILFTPQVQGHVCEVAIIHCDIRQFVPRTGKRHGLRRPT